MTQYTLKEEMKNLVLLILLVKLTFWVNNILLSKGLQYQKLEKLVLVGFI